MNNTQVSKPSPHSVTMAVQALKGFCENYGLEFTLNDIVRFSIAFREHSETEWTPSYPTITRITAIDPSTHSGKYAYVFRSDGFGYAFDSALTEELHQLIAPELNRA